MQMVLTGIWKVIKGRTHDICGKSPDSYNGVEYKKLAPKKDFFMEWKQNHDNDFYIENFNKRVIGLLDPYEVVNEIINFLPAEWQHTFRSSQVPVWENKDFHIVLTCYEKPGDFCHRNLVAEWLTKAGIPVKEIIIK